MFSVWTERDFGFKFTDYCCRVLSCSTDRFNKIFRADSNENCSQEYQNKNKKLGASESCVNIKTKEIWNIRNVPTNR